MKVLLNQIQQFKPSFIPAAIWLLLIGSAALVALCVIALGVWVVFTQVEFL